MNISEYLKINYEINKAFVCSTVHVSQETAEHLERIVHSGHGVFVVYEKSDYGYFIVVDETLLVEGIEMPDDLRTLMRIALANNCYYLELDMDGPEYDNLPQYEW